LELKVQYLEIAPFAGIPKTGWTAKIIIVQNMSALDNCTTVTANAAICLSTQYLPQGL
jgi:hypothetical protein